MNSVKYTLLPEWAEQEAVLLAWPTAKTDWAKNLQMAQQTYLDLIAAIDDIGCSIVLLCHKHDLSELKRLLAPSSKVALVVLNYNDTWIRDYGFLTVNDGINNIPINFLFNAWGRKFEAELDNKINEQLANFCQQKMLHVPIVLEGGAIEIDENQQLLSSASCLFNPERNGDMSAPEYCDLFKQYLGAKTVDILKHGKLEGDDTDGHIDTLARFTPLMGIVVQSANNRPADPHFNSLLRMYNELKELYPSYKIYSLPLPYVVNAEGDRLPASYANFLILNKHILMPIYQQEEDAEALSIVQEAFANYTIVPIDCLSLVQQFGSLHCISMQIPVNTLKTEILAQTQLGVCEL